MSLVIRNLLFTLLHPGLVAGVIPYYILHSGNEVIQINPNIVFRCFSIFLIWSGVLLLIWGIVVIAKLGKGTLSPADPTQKLVVLGPYRYSRNPMYIAVLLILLGEWILFAEVNLLWYLLGIALLFNGFVIFLEEPRLKEDFGEEYVSYQQKVRRWL